MTIEDVLSIGAIITAIGGAWAVLTKAIKPIQALLNRLQVQEAKTTALEKRMDRADHEVKETHGEQGAANQVMILALLALLEHGITGNGNPQLLGARAELHKYLASRG